jgi:hypothetical protein
MRAVCYEAHGDFGERLKLTMWAPPGGETQSVARVCG